MRRLARFIVLGTLFATSALAREPSPVPASVDSLIPSLLQDAAQWRGIPFAKIIAQTTGKKVRAIEPDDATDQRVLGTLGAVLDQVVRQANTPESKVQRAGRINEVSSHFEDLLRELLNAAPGLSCDFPRTASGQFQRAGYPDLRVVDRQSGRVYYLDPKLYAAGSRASSFRTFYFEPKNATNKVRDDAVHLVAGFEHAPREAGRWKFTRWDLVDLANFQVNLKAEFQGSNRDLYRADAIVATSAK